MSIKTRQAIAIAAALIGCVTATITGHYDSAQTWLACAIVIACLRA